MGNVRLLTSEIKEARSEGKHNTIFHSQLKHTAITPITWKSVADIRKSSASFLFLKPNTQHPLTITNTTL